MALKNVTEIESNIKRDDTPSPLGAVIVAALSEPAVCAALRQSDRRHVPMTIMAIARVIADDDEAAEELVRPLTDAAKAGKFEAWRLGGAERGPIISTIDKVEAWLRTQPVVKPVKDAPVADVYELAVRAARGGGR